MSTPTTDPISTELSAAASAVATWDCPLRADILVFENRGTADAWVTINGPAPTVGGQDQLLVPAGQTVSERVLEPPQAEDPAYTGPTVQAVSSAALVLYVEVG